MFNRRMLVALAACLVVSASSAMAGGDGGTKKNSTIEVQNGTPNVLYAFVDVSDQDIEKAAMKSDPLKAFRDLGGKEIQPGASAKFKVAAGNHWVSAVDIEEEEPAGKEHVNVPKGTTVVVQFSYSSSPSESF